MRDLTHAGVYLERLQGVSVLCRGKNKNLILTPMIKCVFGVWHQHMLLHSN